MNATAPEGGVVLSGGVLSDQAIYEMVHSEGPGELIARDTFDADSLRPASYEPRIAHDGLITATGAKFKPGEVGPAKVVLRSGDAAMFSTVEMFRMPADIAGNVTIKNGQATEGLMLLSGLLIDPGYGLDESLDNQPGSRLYLHVANIGKDPITIRPGEDPIARVQFLSVCGNRYPSRQPIKASSWTAQEQPSLGFLTELKELKEQIESTSTVVQNVVMLGFVVLGITLIGVSLSTILSLMLNNRLVAELRSVWPHSSSGKLDIAALLVGVPLCVFASCFVCREVWRGFRMRRRRRLREAWRAFRLRRRQRSRSLS